ncbi:hypothetical protein FIBSPDRAFT_885264 [Athelia psychrophila]|uniref:Uncharacterized protein n=1 Tax=Athelia psychrophila TaxID=1759441 RepID=A0A166S9L8_9AGAM|nr:hypothetical protein FIBSPDRAFT_885264 [Fibularhizoctonia sp. CBS 109695]
MFLSESKEYEPNHWIRLNGRPALVDAAHLNYEETAEPVEEVEELKLREVQSYEDTYIFNLILEVAQSLQPHDSGWIIAHCCCRKFVRRDRYWRSVDSLVYNVSRYLPPGMSDEVMRNFNVSGGDRGSAQTRAALPSKDSVPETYRSLQNSRVLVSSHVKVSNVDSDSGIDDLDLVGRADSGTRASRRVMDPMFEAHTLNSHER